MKKEKEDTLRKPMVCVTCKISYTEGFRFCNKCDRLLVHIQDLFNERLHHLNNIEWCKIRIDELDEIIYSIVEDKKNLIVTTKCKTCGSKIEIPQGDDYSGEEISTFRKLNPKILSNSNYCLVI